ncbi:hypothetical protein [Pseudoalteromonas sp. PPB1]|uniref:hypothetical protein n=1 Tax=Pseudoalteromonas sp. PPB1 TaxID=2756136 RepID=UPI001890CE56|nr:hypothetical protein [Pseudoalteromonas sp. PPB1]
MNLKLLAVVAAIVPGAVCAASAVKQLDVLGNAVTFTLEQPKSHAIPACVSADNLQKWAINLNSLQGQAMYSLLVTAVSKEHLVNVTPANRCEVIADIEQAGSLSLKTNPAQGGVGVSLYKGDGVTKLGTVTNTSNGIQYVPSEGTTWVQHYGPSTLNLVYYVDEQCSGQGYIYHTPSSSPYLLLPKNRFYTKSDSKSENLLSKNGNVPVYQYVSYAEEGKRCQKTQNTANQYDARYTKLLDAEHPLCGMHACVIR